MYKPTSSNSVFFLKLACTLQIKKKKNGKSPSFVNRIHKVCVYEAVSIINHRTAALPRKKKKKTIAIVLINCVNYLIFDKFCCNLFLLIHTFHIYLKFILNYSFFVVVAYFNWTPMSIRGKSKKKKKKKKIWKNSNYNKKKNFSQIIFHGKKKIIKDTIYS